MDFATGLGIYLLLGLPVSATIALSQSTAPIARRVVLSLVVLPFWVFVGIALLFGSKPAPKLEQHCYWCGELINEEYPIEKHLFDCKKHPMGILLGIYRSRLGAIAGVEWNNVAEVCTFAATTIKDTDDYKEAVKKSIMRNACFDAAGRKNSEK